MRSCAFPDSDLHTLQLQGYFSPLDMTHVSCLGVIGTCWTEIVIWCETSHQEVNHHALSTHDMLRVRGPLCAITVIGGRYTRLINFADSFSTVLSYRVHQVCSLLLQQLVLALLQQQFSVVLSPFVSVFVLTGCCFVFQKVLTASYRYYLYLLEILTLCGNRFFYTVGSWPC